MSWDFTARRCFIGPLKAATVARRANSATAPRWRLGLGSTSSTISAARTWRLAAREHRSRRPTTSRSCEVSEMKGDAAVLNLGGVRQHHVVGRRRRVPRLRHRPCQRARQRLGQGARLWRDGRGRPACPRGHGRRGFARRPSAASLPPPALSEVARPQQLHRRDGSQALGRRRRGAPDGVFRGRGREGARLAALPTPAPHRLWRRPPQPGG